MIFERFARPLPGTRETFANMRGHHLGNGLVGFLFAATGPVALILSIGIAGGLTEADLASWIFIGFAGGGVLTFFMSWVYRQPLAMAWTISGSALIGPALEKFSFPEIIGTFFATGLLMMLLGISGGFKKLMDLTPTPIVMAMVAGVFLKFGVLAVDAFDKAMWIAISASVAYALVSMYPRLAARIPPVLLALIVGAVVTVYTGQFTLKGEITTYFAAPKIYKPVFSEASLIELVLPLAVSVLALQNAQGIAILRVAGHKAPSNMITFISGLGSLGFGALGAVCTCLTGPVNAILTSSGERKYQYIGAYFWAALAIGFGVMAPIITKFALAVPEAFIFVLGGLAMLRILQQSFVSAFSGRFTMGALVTFIITVTDLIPGVEVNILGIGAAFWGLVFGFATSLLLEPEDWGKKGDDDDSRAPGVKAGVLRRPGTLELISPVPSPFTNKVCIALAEKGIACHLVEGMVAPAEEDGEGNPLQRSPLLVIDGQRTLFDTRVICEYIDALPGQRELFPGIPEDRLAVKRWEALADGVTEAVMQLAIESTRATRFENEAWFRRQQLKITHGLDAIAKALADHEWCVGDDFTLADVSLVCLLDYLTRRIPEFEWRASHPSLARHLDRVRTRASVAEVLGWA